MLLATFIGQRETAVLRLWIFTGFIAISVGPAWAAEKVEIPPALAKVLADRYPRGVEDLRLLETHVRKITEQALPATVGVDVGRNVGSGVIVSTDGLVLTAAHVIAHSRRKASILLTDGRRLPALTLGANHDIDAGLVRITDPPDDLPFVPISEGDSPEIGQWVVATGQPGGIFEDRSPPVRLGRVLAGENDWLCTDCTLVGGDSGGPLLNMNGEVTAIHTSIGPAVIHNFHVPIEMVQKSWKRLLVGEVWGGAIELEGVMAKPYLGISVQTKGGRCVITKVSPGSPAQQSGIRTDDIVTSIDGDPVNSVDDMMRILAGVRPFQLIHIIIERQGRNLLVEVELSAVPAPPPDESESDDE